MDEYQEGILERIAIALERQVQQHDEQVERWKTSQNDGIERREREVQEARAVNTKLLEEMRLVAAIVVEQREAVKRG